MRIDKFLKKRLDKSLIKIISIRKQIRERIKEREESNDYFHELKKTERIRPGFW